MMRSRKELKALAKRALLGNYGTVAGSGLMAFLAMLAMTIPMLVFTFVMAIAGGAGVFSIIGLVAGLLIWYILILLTGMLFMVGITRICYQCCIGQTGNIGDLLYGFKNHPVRFVGLALLILLIALLGSIPGIILMICSIFLIDGAAGVILYLTGYALCLILMMGVTLRYSLAPFVLIEEPWRKVRECIRLSKDMTDGNKMRLFKLHLSFFGMLLLSYLTFGVGSLWITPYIISTNICFYLSIKEEKYGNVSRQNETDWQAGTENQNNFV